MVGIQFDLGGLLHGGGFGKLLLSEVGGRLQSRGDVHIINKDLLRNLQSGRAEGDDAQNAGLDQFVGHFLRLVGRDGHDAHADTPSGDHFLEIGHIVDRAAADCGPDEGSAVVKPRCYMEHRPVLGEMSQQRASQPAHADQSYFLAGGSGKESLDTRKAGLNLVPAIGTARVADHHQVAPDDSRAYPGQMRKLMRIYAGSAGIAQAVEQPPIEAQPSDRLS